MGGPSDSIAAVPVTAVSGPVRAGKNVFGNELHRWNVSSAKFKMSIELLLPDYCGTPFAILGQGSYGCVLGSRIQTAPDHQEILAIKKYVFRDGNATIAEMKGILREFRFLRLLQHENIITLRTAFSSCTAREKMDDIYLVTDAMDTDLHQVIRTCKRFDESHILFFFYQLIRGLKYIHSAGVVHRDVKPKNLLVTRGCDLRIGDFGMARLFGDDYSKWTNLMTEYVCTRWYRSPELLCSWPKYDFKVDIWGCGCVLAEMYTKEPLFQGKNTLDQLSRITDILGAPNARALSKIPNAKARKYLSEMPEVATQPLHIALGVDLGEEAADVIFDTLDWDPDRRKDCTALLEHVYFSALHDEEDEPTREPVSFKLFDYERRQVGENELLEELFNEMLEHQRQLRGSPVRDDCMS